MTNTNDTKGTIDAATSDFVEFCHTAKRDVITLSPETFEAFIKLLEEPAKPALAGLDEPQYAGRKGDVE